jgi:hypothetical protein
VRREDASERDLPGEGRAWEGALPLSLMAIKARHLHKAGLITELEERWVYSKARTFLDDDRLVPPHRESANPSLPCAII